MNENEWLAERFEVERGRLRGVAFRMLGSLSEADDAVQESWLRLSRSGAGGVENLSGWLTTVVARVCLNMLRARESRREKSLDAQAPGVAFMDSDATDPEHEAILADSVGVALLVVLETLKLRPSGSPSSSMTPSPCPSTRSRRSSGGRRQRHGSWRAARRRIRGSAAVPPADLARQRKVVDAFIAASRSGDMEALLAVLDPDVVLRVDATAVPHGGARELRGAATVARGRSRSRRARNSCRPPS